MALDPLRWLPQSLRRQDVLSWLVVLALVSLAVWAFVELADEVTEGSTRAADQRILEMLRTEDGSPVGPSWLPEMVRDITAMGSWAVLGLFTIGVVGYLLLRRSWHTAVLVILAVATAQLANSGLKQLFNRPRPDAAIRIAEVATLSFPSGHSMLSVVLYLTLGALLARVVATRRERLYIMGCAIFLAVIIGLSRIYLGVHYPSDVLAGWTAGFAWAVLWWGVAYWWGRRRAAADDTGRNPSGPGP